MSDQIPKNLMRILRQAGKRSNIPSGSPESKLIYMGVGLAALGYLGYNSFFNVDGGYRGVVFNKISGVKTRVYEEGVHFKLPWFEVPTLFDVRSRARAIGSPTGTKDLQMVNISVRVLFRPRINSLPLIFQTLGVDYDERVLPSIVNEVLKSVVAQFNASQLITQREQVSLLVRNRLVERAHDFNIELTDVSLTHISFGKEYSAAIEAKQVAQQEAERAKFIVEKAEQEKKSLIVQAEGEAESARLINEAIRSDPNFLYVRKIEAARDIAKIVSKSPNHVYLNSDNLLFSLVRDEENPITKQNSSFMVFNL